MAARAGVGEYAIEVVGTRRLFEAGEEEGVVEAQSFEQPAAILQRLVQQRAAVEVEQVEDHQHHRHLIPELVRDLLATQAALELEEPQHASLSMRADLAVEKHGMSYPRGRLGKTRTP